VATLHAFRASAQPLNLGTWSSWHGCDGMGRRACGDPGVTTNGSVLWETAHWTCAEDVVVSTNGVLYYSSDAGCNASGLLAMNATDGSPMWSLPLNVETSPVLGADGVLYASTRGGPGQARAALYAVDTAGNNGSVRWQTVLPDSNSNNGVVRPIVSAAGTVYVSANRVFAVNGTTGNLVWQSPSMLTQPMMPALGLDGTLYVPDFTLYAMDAANGTVKWKIATDCSGFNSPALSPDGTVVYATHVGGGGCGDALTIAALDAVTGTQLWLFAEPGEYVSAVGPPAVGADGTLYTSTGESIVALSPVNGSVLWTTRLPVPGGAVAVGADGSVYAMANGLANTFASAVDGATGKLKWSTTIKGSGVTSAWSAPSIGPDGTLYMQSNKMVAFTPVKVAAAPRSSS
jgi:outer membrane protein assembly factor BamB